MDSVVVSYPGHPMLFACNVEKHGPWDDPLEFGKHTQHDIDNRQRITYNRDS